METNSELQKQLAELIKNLNESGLAALDFAKGEAPEFVSQMYALGYVVNVTSIILSLVLIGAAIYFGKVFRKKKREASGYDEDIWLGLWVLSTILSVVFSCIAIANVFDLIRLVVAPKVWLINEISGLV